MNWLGRLRRWFYAGPRDFGWSLRRRKGYQSPTATLFVWLFALGARHVAMPGRIVLVCFVLIGPYMLTTLAFPAHLLAVGTTAFLAVDVLAGLILRPRVEVRRVLPARMAAGAEATVTYEVAKRGTLPCMDAEVDSLPLPRTLRFSRGRVGFGELRKGGTVRRTTRIHALARGEFRIPAVRVSSGFPFHLFRFGTTAGNPETMVVYPAFTPLQSIELPGGVRHHAEGASQSPVAGSSLEFLGCREFREGDNLRHLHMRSWARRGAPVVKEFREEYFCRMGLVLDTVLERRFFEPVRRRLGPRAEFEAMVSLTAAVGEYFNGRDFAVDLFAAGNRVIRFGGARSLSAQDRILEILGSQNYVTDDNFEQLETNLLAAPPDLGGVLFIVGLWNQTRRRLIDELLARGTPCKVVFVHPHDEPPESVGLPGLVTYVTAESIRDGACTRL